MNGLQNLVGGIVANVWTIRLARLCLWVILAAAVVRLLMWMFGVDLDVRINKTF